MAKKKQIRSDPAQPKESEKPNFFTSFYLLMRGRCAILPDFIKDPNKRIEGCELVLLVIHGSAVCSCDHLLMIHSPVRMTHTSPRTEAR